MQCTARHATRHRNNFAARPPKSAACNHACRMPLVGHGRIADPRAAIKTVKRQSEILTPFEGGHVFGQRPARPARVIVVGNEKGGSGKSTVAMHVAVALVKAGQKIATIDLDIRQRSLTHYVENRRAWGDRIGRELEGPAASLSRRPARRDRSMRGASPMPSMRWRRATALS